MNQSQQLMEAMGGGGEVKVYAKDRKTVLATVSKQTTSVGAAKKAGIQAVGKNRVDGTMAWVETELR